MFSYHRNLIKLCFNIISNVHLELFFFSKNLLQVLIIRNWLTIHFYRKQYQGQPGLSTTQSHSTFNKGWNPPLSRRAVVPVYDNDDQDGTVLGPLGDYCRLCSFIIWIKGKRLQEQCDSTELSLENSESCQSFSWWLVSQPQANHSLHQFLSRFLLTAKRAK